MCGGGCHQLDSEVRNAKNPAKAPTQPGVGMVSKTYIVMVCALESWLDNMSEVPH